MSLCLHALSLYLQRSCELDPNAQARLTNSYKRFRSVCDLVIETVPLLTYRSRKPSMIPICRTSDSRFDRLNGIKSSLFRAKPAKYNQCRNRRSRLRGVESAGESRCCSGEEGLFPSESAASTRGTKPHVSGSLSSNSLVLVLQATNKFIALKKVEAQTLMEVNYGRLSIVVSDI